MTQTGLAFQDLSVSHGGTPIVGPLSARVARAGVLTIMGPSGCGKTSILKALMGLLEPPFAVRGSVTLNGVTLDGVPTHKRKIGLMFQDDMLFAHLTVAQNLAFGMAAQTPKALRMQAITEALQRCELPGYHDRYPEELSGGQRTRVSLMRTLLYGPHCILMDEPFSSLDTALRQRMRRFVKQQLHRSQIAALIVTHDIADHEDLGGQLLVLRDQSITR